MAGVVKGNVMETKNAAERLVLEALTAEAIVAFQVAHPAVVSRRTFVFRREGQSWLITHLHASNIRLDPK